MSRRIVFIGAGSLATHLSIVLKQKGYDICQVYSRTEISAKNLGTELNTDYTTDPQAIINNADLYFIALKDDVYNDVLPFVDFNDNLVVHCSGSMQMSILEKYSSNYGVFYPLQTFSKWRNINFKDIPVFVEGNSGKNEKKLLKIAGEISDRVSVIDSDKRLYLHIAAVFACNFVNYFYSVASDILSSQKISFDVLVPLITETAHKIEEALPLQAQTGPAVRFDMDTISKHLESLNVFPHYRDLYNLISNGIFNRHSNSDSISQSDNLFQNAEAFIFDIDGVLSMDTSSLNSEGDPVRTANVKDGYAIRNAVKMGFPVAIMTGGKIESVRKRYEKLGVEYYYDNVSNKKDSLSDFMEKTGLNPAHILYMGDDLVDLEVMKTVGIPVCPVDAVNEIKSLSKYISPEKGGEGCVRDVIEKTLRAQNRWLLNKLHINRAF
jgi:YrbI family 3-deoxy-D-manno-octulosonate 8-phosphate phosphatase